MDIIFVDVKNKMIELKTIEKDINVWYELIGTDMVQIVSRIINGKSVEIICDEEGKLKSNPIISGVCTNADECLVGNLIIKSDDLEIAKNIVKDGVLKYSVR